MARLRYHPTPEPPEEMGSHDGLAYALWRPEGPPAGGVVILHGAGSSKESHFDFGREARAFGFAAVAFDQRGHGESEGVLDGRAIDDIAAMAALLGPGPVALRGSSMGGYLALVAAQAMGAAAVVAICPAGSEQLLRGVRDERFDFGVDAPAFSELLAANSLERVVAELDAPMLLLHAEGDEQIPVAHSAELYRVARMPRKRFVALPGGHHRSIQHDAEMQGVSLRFISRALAGRS